jgi:hypothetical protein
MTDCVRGELIFHQRGGTNCFEQACCLKKMNVYLITSFEAYEFDMGLVCVEAFWDNSLWIAYI